jgi:hypothetical protein
MWATTNSLVHRIKARNSVPFFFLPTPNRNAAASLFCQQETKTSWMDMDVQLSRASTTTFISSDRSSSPLPAKKILWNIPGNEESSTPRATSWQSIINSFNRHQLTAARPATVSSHGKANGRRHCRLVPPAR